MFGFSKTTRGCRGSSYYLFILLIFVVLQVNDLCHEHHPEYILLTLSVPGAAALGGEDYIAKVRRHQNRHHFSSSSLSFEA